MEVISTPEDYGKWRDANRYLVPGRNVFKCYAAGKRIDLSKLPCGSGCSLVAAMAIGIIVSPNDFYICEYDNAEYKQGEISFLSFGETRLPYQLVPLHGMKFKTMVPKSVYGRYLEPLRQELAFILSGGKDGRYERT